MKKFYSLVLVAAALLLPLKVGAQSLNENYLFSTGVDAEKWLAIGDDATTVSIANSDDAVSGLMPIGFSFTLADSSYTQWSMSTNGRIRLGDMVITSAYQMPFYSSTNLSVNLPLISFMGCDGYFYSADNPYAKYKVLGEEGQRVLVIEVHMSMQNAQGTTYDVQVQLSEADQSVTMVYGPRTGNSSKATQIGISASTTDLVMVDVATNTPMFFTTYSTASNPVGTWPELNRWYKFTFDPDACIKPTGLTLADTTFNSATLSWNANPQASYYSLMLGPDNYVTTTDTSYTFTGLTYNTTYVAMVRSFCDDEDSSNASILTFTTPCADTYTTDMLPFYEDFQHYNSNASNWTCVDYLNYRTNTTSVYPTILDGTDWAAVTAHMCYFQPGDDTMPQYLIFPQFENITDLRCHLYTKRGVGTVWVDVGVMDGTTDTSTFVTVATIGSVAGSSDWSDFTITFDEYTGTGSNLAFRAWSEGPSGSYILIDDILVTLNTGCTSPDSLTVSNVGTNSATVNIHHAGSGAATAYQMVVATSAGSDTTVIANIASVPLTGLTASTVYDVYISAICGNEVTLPTRVTFNTECATLEHDDLPFVENFDSYAYNANAVINQCYGRLSFNSAYPVGPYPKNEYQRVAGVGNTFYFYPGNGTEYQYWTLPPMADVQDLAMNLSVRRPSTNQVIDVGVMTDPEDDSSFTLMHTIAPSSLNTLQDFNIEFNAYEGDGNYIALRARTTGSSSNYIVVDDIKVYVNSCPKPTGLHLASFEDGTATIEWNDVAEATGYYLLATTDSSIVVETIGENSYTFSDISGNSEYPLILMSICGTDSSQAVLTSIQTPIDTLPYFQDFETMSTSSTNVMPSGWKHIGMGNITYVNSGSYSWQNSMTLKFQGATGDNVVLLPAMPEEISGLYLQMQTRPEGTSSSSGQFDVGYVTNAMDAGSFVAVATYDYSEFNDAFVEVYETFAGAPDGARIAMRHRAASTGWYWFVDEVEVGVANCIRPSIPTVGNIGETEATVSWLPVEGAETYIVVVDDDTTTVTDGDTSHIFTGLMPGVAHSVRLARICDNGDTSHFSQAVRFFTLCGVIAEESLPYIEDFEGFDANVRDTSSAFQCWTFVHPHGENSYSNNGYCTITTSYAQSGSKTLRFSGYADNPMVAVLPAFAANTSTLKLTMYLRAENSTSYDGTLGSPGAIRVGYITDIDDTTTFVQTARFECTSGLYSNMTLDSAYFAGAPDSARIAIEQVNNNTNYWWWIDDITISVADSVPPVQPTIYTVSVATADATMGSATADHTGSVAAGTVVTATATPAEGYEFSHWSTGYATDVLSADNPYTFTVTGNTSLTAHFEQLGEPSCLTPTGLASSNVTATSATVSWTPGGSETRWQVTMLDPGPTDVYEVTTTTLNLTGLEPNTEYKLYIKAICEEGLISAPTETLSFTTLDNNGIEAVDGSPLSVYPNPASSVLTIGGLTADAHVTLIDVNGSVMGEWKAADATLTIDVNALPRGVYFVRVTDKDRSTAKRVVLQ